jgi:hypothetical protein
MRERTALIRGEIEIVSELGMGTTVRLKVSAPEARDQRISTDELSKADSERSEEQQ